MVSIPTTEQPNREETTADLTVLIISQCAHLQAFTLYTLNIQFYFSVITQ